METRFTIIYKWTNGKWLVQHLHQSTPDLEQMDGEEFPVTLGKQVKKTRQAFHALGTAYYLILRLDLKTKRVELIKKNRKIYLQFFSIIPLLNSKVYLPQRYFVPDQCRLSDF